MNQQATNPVKSNTGHVSTNNGVLQSKPTPIWRNTTKYNHQQTKPDTTIVSSSPQFPKKVTTKPPRSNSVASTPKGALPPNSTVVKRLLTILPNPVKKPVPNVPNSVKGTVRVGGAAAVADKRFQNVPKSMAAGGKASRKGPSILPPTNTLNVILRPHPVSGKTESSVDSQMFSDTKPDLTEIPKSHKPGQFVAFNVEVEENVSLTNANIVLGPIFEEDEEKKLLEDEKGQILVNSKEDQHCIMKKDTVSTTEIQENTIVPLKQVEEMATILITGPSQEKLVKEENLETATDHDLPKEEEKEESSDLTGQPEVLKQEDATDVPPTESDYIINEEVINFVSSPIFISLNQESTESTENEVETFTMANQESSETPEQQQGGGGEESSPIVTDPDILTSGTVQITEEEESVSESESKTELDQFMEQHVEIEKNNLTSQNEVLLMDINNDESNPDTTTNPTEEESDCFCFNFSGTSQPTVQEHPPSNESHPNDSDLSDIVEPESSTIFLDAEDQIPVNWTCEDSGRPASNNVKKLKKNNVFYLG